MTVARNTTITASMATRRTSATKQEHSISSVSRTYTKNGFSAVTVSSSSSSSIGTRWNYTFNGNQVRIEDVSTRRQFVQTRCSPIHQQVAAVGSVSDDMQEKIPGGFVKTITRQSAGQTTLDKQLSANGVMLELTGPPLQHYRLTVNGAKLEQMDGFPRFQGVYGSYVLLEEGTGGTACPSLYRVIDLSGTIPTLTSQFGSCSDLPIVTLTANGLRVVTPAMSGPISQTVLISGGRVTKCRPRPTLTPASRVQVHWRPPAVCQSTNLQSCNGLP